MSKVVNRKIRLNISKDCVLANFKRNVQLDINPDFSIPFLNKSTGGFEKITLKKAATFGKYSRINYDSKVFRGSLINEHFFLRYNKKRSPLEVYGQINGDDTHVEIEYNLKILGVVYYLTIVLLSLTTLFGFLILLFFSNKPLALFIIISQYSFFLLPLYRAKRAFKREEKWIDSLIKMIFSEK